MYTSPEEVELVDDVVDRGVLPVALVLPAREGVAPREVLEGVGLPSGGRDRQEQGEGAEEAREQPASSTSHAHLYAQVLRRFHRFRNRGA